MTYAFSAAAKPAFACWILSALLFVLPSIAHAQSWSSSPLNNNVIVYAGPGFFHTDPLFVRSGQQPVLFDLGPTSGANSSHVRVNGGSWQSLGAGGPYIWWTNPPTALGVYDVDFKYVGPGNPNGNTIPFTLTVVPAATARFGDGAGNTMVFWKGGSSFNDHPFLMVEGIDAENKNSENTYFALASELFSQAIALGADVYVLNFNDGGRDLRLNADVVESTVGFLNGSRRASGARLDVAGISMGGVVVRIALARMEEGGPAHQVDNFLSIDAPQDGAVLQHSLVDFIKEQVDLGRIEPPENLTSTAGRQLLEYNVYASPNESVNFFNEINQINGDGYPHLSQNLGVSFGTQSSTPYPGQRWARFEIRTHLGILLESEDFNITSEVAVPGSYLPLDATNIWAYGCAYGAICGTGEMLRFPPKHPAFIPTASALHESGGQSRFDETMTAATQSFHDRMPTELANRLLDWLGYQVPTLTAFITGPTYRATGQSGTWTASASNGSGSYDYTWEYRINFDFCSGGGGDDPPGPPGPEAEECGAWTHNQYYDGSPTFSKTVNYDAGMDIRVTVTSGSESVTAYKYVTIGSGPGDGIEPLAGGGGAAATASAQSGTAALPELYAMHAAAPNPVSSTATIRYDLPEPSRVLIAVYDLLGREVARLVEGSLPAGWHRARLDGSRLSAGVYLVRMEAGERVFTTRITRVR